MSNEKPEELVIYEDTFGPTHNPEQRSAAGKALVELTRRHMAETGEKDFSRASFEVAKKNPELVKLYIDGGE